MLDFVSGSGPNPLVSEVSVLDGTMGSLGQTMTGWHNVLDCTDSVSTGWYNGLDDTGDVHIIRTLSLTAPTRAWARHTGPTRMLFTLIGPAGHMTNHTGPGFLTSPTGYKGMETTTSSHTARRPILFPLIGPMTSHMGMVCNTAAATTQANTTTKIIQISTPMSVPTIFTAGARTSHTGYTGMDTTTKQSKFPQLYQCPRYK
jgi:hypothetical protein